MNAGKIYTHDRVFKVIISNAEFLVLPALPEARLPSITILTIIKHKIVPVDIIQLLLSSLLIFPRRG